MALGLALAPSGIAGVASPNVTSDTRDLTAYVNPLSGTLGAGFPMVGASLPFGMIQQGPDTGIPGAANPVNYDGYAFTDTDIRGFSLTHFDGAGIHISGDLPFMPTTGAVTSTDFTQYQSLFSHVDEVAQPGYYAVGLTTYNTRVELASTPHAGIQRYTFPSTTVANVLLNASLSINGMHPATVNVVGNNAFQGLMSSTSNPASGYTLYFTAVFDRPFSSWGTWSGGTITPGSTSTSSGASGAYATFDTTSNRVVNLRVGLSYVDLAGSAANLAAEIPAGMSLDTIRTSAHNAWNARLHDIEVSTADVNLLQTLYTNLYRALTMPSRFDDIDGRYIGFDGTVHTVPGGHHHYTNLSLWDTYRTQNPLLELIEPAVAHDVYISMLDDYDQNGMQLPKWTDANRDYQIMGGDSATPTIVDGVMSGVLQGAEAQRAYAAVLHQAMTVTPQPAYAREHLVEDLSHGYIPYESGGSRAAAETQEYAIADAAVYGLAIHFGDSTSAAALRTRADFWKNLIDPGQLMIRPRNGDGTWADPCSSNPLVGPCPPHPWSPLFQDGYQEATGWQQTWLESHDVAGLAAAMGGPSATVSKLDTFFSQALTDLPYVVPLTQQYSSFFGIYYIGNQFTPANEPDLQSPWFYDYLGQPYKTQQVVRAAMDTYNQRPDGLPGNDDTGTMSSWFVLASIGMYHVTPGVPAWELNSPSFDTVRLHLGSPKATFTINAPGSSLLNKYVQSATLAGATLNRPYVTACELRPGGNLTYGLAATANTAWGASSPPPSLSDPTANPLVSTCAGEISAGGSASG
ncbi:MAG TPA: GH92 family glycosyl hydrolase [Candidatus Solibacter sp.]|jgi:predicted alpha-1,2-mannosidase|nr:GH92 family glycosyl hydrolase [Candidatus Solibacter sp.]